MPYYIFRRLVCYIKRDYVVWPEKLRAVSFSWGNTVCFSVSVDPERLVFSGVGCSPNHAHCLSLIMSSALSSNLTCDCGRVFAQHNALSNHQRNCQTSKGRVVGVLSRAKDMLHARKRRRLEKEVSSVPGSETPPVPSVESSRSEQVRN